MSKLPRSANDDLIQTGSLHGAATQIVVTGAASAKSAALGATTQLIRVVAVEPCFIRLDATGESAVVTDMPILAGIPEYFGVIPGLFVHAITAGGAGTLTITEV